MRARTLGGFTLLEVMVAVAILAIALTAIFSSQAGAIRAGARARHMTTASLLARCKMAEIEEHMVRDGFPAVSESGEDECCEGGEHEGFRCEWTVDRVELPDTVESGGPGGLSGLGGDHEGDTAGAGDIEAALTGAAGGDAVGEMAMQAAFPVLRPLIEEQVRRATVTVIWGEGEGARSFDVSQYLVADQGQTNPNAPDPNAPAVPGQPGQAGQPGQPGQAGQPGRPNLPSVPTIPNVRLPR